METIFNELIDKKVTKINDNCKIITIEGIDGSGKTTTVENVINNLRKRGYKAEHFYTSSNYNEYWKVVEVLVKEKLIDKSVNQMLHTIAFLTYSQTELINLINNNDFIISEWYIYGKKVLSELYDSCNDLSKKAIEYYENNNILIKPDYSFYIELSVQEARKRIEDRKGKIEEKESLNMLYKAKKLWDYYIDFYNIERIDGTKSMEVIENYIVEKVLKK